MSEPTPEKPIKPAAPAPSDPTVEDKPLGENGEKALKAERDARSAAEKQAAALQKQLDDIAAANLSDLEKAQKAATDAQEVAAKATADALRFKVAAKHGISEEDADLFLTGTDEATLLKQAERLAERTPSSSQPKPDLSQGPKGTPAAGTPEQDFANFLGAQMGA